MIGPLRKTHETLVSIWNGQVEAFSSLVFEAQNPKKPSCVEEVVEAAELAVYHITDMAKAVVSEGTNYTLAIAAYNVMWGRFHDELLVVLNECREKGPLTEEVLPNAAAVFCDAWCRLAEIQEFEATMTTAFQTSSSVVADILQGYLVGQELSNTADLLSTMQCYVRAKHLEVLGHLNAGAVEQSKARFILLVNRYVEEDEATGINKEHDRAVAEAGYTGVRVVRKAADTPERACSTLFNVLASLSQQ